MYYRICPKLKEKLEKSIQKNSHQPRCEIYNITPREITPQDPYLANKRIGTTQEARENIRKYRFTQEQINETHSILKLINNFKQLYKKYRANVVNLLKCRK